MNKEEILENFRNLLYPNNEEAVELNGPQTKKIIFEALREFLKAKEYQFEVGSYSFDITPKNLSVVYETDDTRIEISNNDIHFETTRQTPRRCFVVSDEKKDVYPGDTPCIDVVGNIIQYDNLMLSEQYAFEIFTDKQDEKIMNYLQVPEGYELIESKLVQDDKAVVMAKDIKVTDPRTNLNIFFKSDKIRPVELDYFKNQYTPKEYTYEGDYQELVPNLKNKKEIISTIYSTIVEFYSNYIGKY